MRIAMWSGPRNLSTAMMYAFGNRRDFNVIDEPFYAAYLARTGLLHPMRKEILESQSTDPEVVINSLTGSIPRGVAHVYQKHMTQHMIDGIRRGWIRAMVNIFLIRHPARVAASFGAKYENVQLADLGFARQAKLFDELAERGNPPIVIDSADIRENPETMLRTLCDAIDLEFDPAMLSWPVGGHSADGVWARHWYGAVHRSTGFVGPEGVLPELSGHLADLAEQSLGPYTQLSAHKLRPVRIDEFSTRKR